MFTHASRLSAIVLATTVVAAALTVSSARADVSDRDMQFCGAIGLVPENHAACRSELANAMTEGDRKIIQAKFVSLDSLDTGLYSGSLFNPPTDSNRLNGMPGTPYQSKPAFVSNRVASEIRDAIYPK